MEKRSTSLFQPVNRKTRPEQLQLAREPSEKKGGRNFILATRECCLETSLFSGAILPVWVVWVSSRRSSRIGLLTLHSCRWPSLFADQPCEAVQAPSGTSSSLSRH